MSAAAAPGVGHARAPRTLGVRARLRLSFSLHSSASQVQSQAVIWQLPSKPAPSFSWQKDKAVKM